jgi:hypothetical protein
MAFEKAVKISFLPGIHHYSDSLINKYLPIETPSTASIRQWVYRLGYYELIEQSRFKRAHFKRANWVLIADFTAQIGVHKCFI